MSAFEPLDTLRLQNCKFDGLEWVFVSDSQDVQPVRDSLPKGIGDDYGAFFVKVGDGEYLEVWGIHGTVPYTHKNAYRLK